MKATKGMIKTIIMPNLNHLIIRKKPDVKSKDKAEVSSSRKAQ